MNVSLGTSAGIMYSLYPDAEIFDFSAGLITSPKLPPTVKEASINSACYWLRFELQGYSRKFCCSHQNLKKSQKIFLENHLRNFQYYQNIRHFRPK
jgi:hypothetical protein